MHLYSGTSVEFIQDATHNQIAEKLEANFEDEYRYKPSKGEVQSWRESLTRMAGVLRNTEMLDHGVVVELQLPLTSKRLDCMITGHDTTGRPSAVVVELKQWSDVQPSPVPECVTTFVGKGMRDVLHPSAQAGDYRAYLADTHTAFADSSIRLESCAWLHNMNTPSATPLFAEEFAPTLALTPTFLGDTVDDLESYLAGNLEQGDGLPVLETVLAGRYRPHKRLLDHVARMIEAEPAYTLLDEQKVAYNDILAHVRTAKLRDEQTVFLIRGGPGTGKSLIAINLLGEVSSMGFAALHATGSKAFTETIWATVGKRAAKSFTYFNKFVKAEPLGLDILVLDEAHRVRETSNHRFTRKTEKSDRAQIEELLDAARTTVFFIDDLQVVRPGEVGSSELIRESAAAKGIKVVERELETQFRCGGSDHYVSWVANLLDIERTRDIMWDPTEDFDFDIVDTPHELEALIRAKHADGYNARLAAGYCWPWSDPRDDGTLEPDVKIDDWSMPWNARPDAGRLAAGIPKASVWATDPGGIDQVGCVYTAQGFEYDYAGVIIGKDLVWRPREGWIGQPEFSKDSAVTRKLKSSHKPFVDLVRHTYRVLLTRGLLGCYVYVDDEQTRDFILSRIERKRR